LPWISWIVEFLMTFILVRHPDDGSIRSRCTDRHVTGAGHIIYPQCGISKFPDALCVAPFNLDSMVWCANPANPRGPSPRPRLSVWVAGAPGAPNVCGCVLAPTLNPASVHPCRHFARLRPRLSSSPHPCLAWPPAWYLVNWRLGPLTSSRHSLEPSQPQAVPRPSLSVSITLVLNHSIYSIGLSWERCPTSARRMT
jgi:hypothetical protein